MTTGPAILTVFVASPGGLTQERDSVDQIAGRLNATLGTTLDVRVDVRRFEQLLGHSGAPQDQINPWVDECDVLIGILHRRWGFPTASRDSGFAEEYERARERHEATGTPEIYLFFKAVDEQSLADPGPQLEGVLRFRRQIEDTRESFYNDFHTVDEFQTEVLHLLVHEMHRRGRIGPTGEGYSQPHSATGQPQDVAESDSPEEGELQSVLQRFVDVVSGRELSGPLDFDRLELFALSASRDGALLPTHLTNRLFQKRGELDLRAIEARAWLRTYLGDHGRAKYLSERVVPYALVAGGDGHLSRELREHAAEFLGDSDAEVRRGFLRVAATLRVRPKELWPPAPVKSGDAEQLVARWSTAIQSATDLVPALEYWLAVRSRGDEQRAAALAGSATGEAGRLGTILTSLFDPEPDPSLLAEAAPELLASPRVRRRFGRGGPYASMAQEQLERLCLRYGVPDQIRTEALDELVRRDVISASLLVRVINEENYDSFGYRWERAARARIFDQGASEATVQQFTSVLSNLKKRGVIRDLTARLARHNGLVREAADDMIRWDARETMLTSERLEAVLTAARGTREHVALALDVAVGHNRAMAAHLADLEQAGSKPNVVEFVRQKMKICALEYLAESAGDGNDGPWLNELRTLASSARYVQHTALAVLLRVGTAKDVDLLLSHIDTIFTAPRGAVVRQILEKASVRKLESLLEDAREAVAPCALDELRRRTKPPSRRRALALMRSSDDRLRMIALEIACEGLSGEQVRELVDEYMSGEGTYYYNVVCELDRRATGVPATHPYMPS